MDYLRELRNIRITLIVLTIVIIFATGNSNNNYDAEDVIVEIPEEVNVNSTNEPDPSFINLGNGNFGIYNSYSDNLGGPSLAIYCYDEKAKKLILQTEQAIGTEE